MKKIIFISFIGLMAIVFSGCSVNPSKLSDKYAKDFIKNITYVKDSKTGLCFGIIASRKTGSTDSSGIGITCVPCENVNHLIKK